MSTFCPQRVLVSSDAGHRASMTLLLLAVGCGGDGGASSENSTTATATSDSANTPTTSASATNASSSNGSSDTTNSATTGNDSTSGNTGTGTTGTNNSSGGAPNTTGTMSSTSMNTGTGGAATTTGGTTGGGTTGGGTTGGGTTGGDTPTGTPYVFVGSTNGSLRAFTMNPDDGSLEAAGEENTGNGLDFIALGPDRRTVFISRSSSLAAYSYDPSAESFTSIDEINVSGGGTYVAVDPTGGTVLVASYNEGLLSLFNYDAAGGFSAGPTFQPGMNAHQVRIDRAGEHVYVPCLGSNHIAQYDLDPGVGSLTAQATPTVAAAGGPRHMVLHPTAPVAYQLTENSSQIHVFDVNPSTGSLEPRPSDSVFTADDAMYHWSSDVQITPDGRFLYAVNRDEPEVVRYEVQADQSLMRLGADPLSSVVRSFGMDPAGGYLQIGGEDGNLVGYRIDSDTGSLTQTASQPGLGNIHTTVIAYLE